MVVFDLGVPGALMGASPIVMYVWLRAQGIEVRPRLAEILQDGLPATTPAAVTLACAGFVGIAGAALLPAPRNRRLVGSRCHAILAFPNRHDRGCCDPQPIRTFTDHDVGFLRCCLGWTGESAGEPNSHGPCSCRRISRKHNVFTFRGRCGLLIACHAAPRNTANVPVELALHGAVVNRSDGCLLGHNRRKVKCMAPRGFLVLWGPRFRSWALDPNPSPA